MTKDKELFGLHKVPLDALLRDSRIEVGKLNAYISELEYENEQLKIQLAAKQQLEQSDEFKTEIREYAQALKETEILKTALGAAKNLRASVKQVRERNKELSKELIDVTLQAHQWFVDDIGL